MVDEIEQCRLRPVNVVEDQDQRAAAGERLREAPHGAERVFARHDFFVRQSDCRRHGVEQTSCLGIGRKHLAQLGVGRDLLEDLDEREVRYPVAVSEAAPTQHDRVTLRIDELENEARLADAGRPEHGEELTRAVAHRSGVRLDELLQLAAAADERSIEPSLEARRVRSDTQQPVGDERLRLSFCVDRLGTFEFERALGKLPRGVPDQNVARLRGLLEPRGDVDGVTGRKGAALARHDLAGVDSHPDLQLGAELALKVRIEVAELFAQLVRGPSGA